MGTKAVGGASGKHGRIHLYNSDPALNYELCVTEWSLTENVQEEDVTNSCSEGKREFEYGAKWVEGRFTLDLDLAAHPLDDPPNLNVGQLIVGSVTLYEHTDSIAVPVSAQWQLRALRILSVEITTPAAGKVQYVINWKNSGDYSFFPQTASN